MQLFYHGTRDIELPTAGRGTAPSASSPQCEACGRPLIAGAVSDDSAHGLTFCVDCRTRVDRSAIQIHFCDACGVSVPLEDVEEGRALATDGRILCGVCHVPAPATAALPVAWVIAAVAAIAAGAILAWFS